MTKKLLLLVPFLLLMIGNSFSVDKPTSKGWCASEVPSLDWESQIQRIIQMQQAQHAANGREQQISYTIPVIVHICYYQNTTSQNISATRVQSQISILNNDFAGTGLNSSTPVSYTHLKHAGCLPLSINFKPTGVSILFSGSVTQTLSFPITADGRIIV